MRIVIVDDHAIMRRGMAHVVEHGFPDADVVEAGSASAALDAMREQVADVVLVDVRMPDLDGLDLLRAMKVGWPDVPVIMLSTHEYAPYLKRALSDGAAGYLLKDATLEDLGQAIDAAISGGGSIPQRALRTMFEDLASSGGVASVSPDRIPPDPARARDPGAPVRGAEQPLHRAEPVRVRRDREGTPRRDLPQAGGHEPHAGRDDGRGVRRGTLSASGHRDGRTTRGSLMNVVSKDGPRPD